MIETSLFVEFSVVLAVAAVLSFVMRLLRQPLIIGHIIAGVLVGPFVFNLLHSLETFTLFSEIGIAILLFTVGLGLSPHVVKEFGRVSVITGLGQVFFTSIAGFAISSLLGFSVVESVYIGIALAFSSTIIILKLISDRGDLETLYAKISIGFLLVQDFVAILLLFIIPLLANPNTTATSLVWQVVTGVAVILGLLLVSGRLMPRMNRFLASSQELLLIFTVAWGAVIATLFKYLGFSIESGALIAGVALASLQSRDVIIARLMPLRDFFLILFFVLLGSQLVLVGLTLKLVAAIVLSLLVLIGNPIILMIILGRMGFRRRTSLFTGFTVAQISEFSLILVVLGVKLGHLSQDILSLVTLVGMITIFGSTYLILYADRIYTVLAPYLGIFERDTNTEPEPVEKKYEAILFGCNRIGYDFLVRLKKEYGGKLLVIDNSPEVVAAVQKEKVDVRLADIGDVNFIDSLDYSKTKVVISTVPDPYSNTLIHEIVKERNPKTLVYVTAHRVSDALMYYRKGVDYVVLPHLLGGKYASDLLVRTKTKGRELKSLRTKHVEYLKKRSRKGFTMNYPHRHSSL